MLLTSPDEVRSYIAETLLDALSQPAVIKELGGRARRLRLGLVDPDCVFVIDAGAHRVTPGPWDGATLSGFVAMSGDTAIAWCRGVLDLERALASGEIAADGECAHVMRVLATTARLDEPYVARLAHGGRADLIGSALRAG